MVWVVLEWMCFGAQESLWAEGILEGLTALQKLGQWTLHWKGLGWWALCPPHALTFQKHTPCTRPGLGHAYIYSITQCWQHSEVVLCFTFYTWGNLAVFIFPDENPAWGNSSQVANYLEPCDCFRQRNRANSLSGRVEKLNWMFHFELPLLP
jgi:hypothetical protein